jgi:hypothetical protein
MWWANRATIGVGAVLVAALMASNYYHVREMTDLSQQASLRLYGEGIYEYHALTGKWPSKMNDLDRTSLPLQYPHWWKAQLDIEADVIACLKNLKPDPKANGDVILCYHHKGLDAEQGRMWVCWGDLRTTWITREELNAHLQANEE